MATRKYNLVVTKRMTSFGIGIGYLLENKSLKVIAILFSVEVLRITYLKNKLMIPLPGVWYSYFDDLGLEHSAQFLPGKNTYSPPGTAPVQNKPYTYIDPTQLSIVVFFNANNLQLVGGPMGDPYVDEAGNNVYDVQVQSGPNPLNYDSMWFNLRSYNIESNSYVQPSFIVNLQNQDSSTSRTKPHIYSSSGVPMGPQIWPHAKFIIEEEFNAAIEKAINRMQKLLDVGK